MLLKWKCEPAWEKEKNLNQNENYYKNKFKNGYIIHNENESVNQNETRQGGFITLSGNYEEEKKWYVTSDSWHMTHDTWYMIHDTWHLTGDRWEELNLP